MKLEKLEVLLCKAGWRTWVFVRAEADGLIGWSEVTDSHGSVRGLKATIEDLSSLVLGKNVAPERVYWELYQRTRQTPGGLIAKAIGGIENALWDLKGKELGVPVYELFGGPTRDTIPCYWSHCGTTRARAWEVTKTPKLTSYNDVRKLALEVHNRGYSAVKTNLVIPGETPMVLMPGFGGGPPDGLCTPALLDALDELVDAFQSQPIGVILDLNFNLKPEFVIQIANRLPLLWLEVDCYDPEALAEIRRKSPIPICTGENLYGNRQARPYLESRSCDILSVDLPWNGLSQSKKMADMAETFEVNITPHNYYSHLSTFMAANYCAVIPNVRMLEVDVDDVPWKDEITSRPEIVWGNMTLPTGSGWGCEVNETMVRGLGT